MTSQRLIGLLVGAHFRPPAKSILKYLPANTELELDSEPDNQYDPHALRVSVYGDALTWLQGDEREAEAELDLNNQGYSLADVINNSKTEHFVDPPFHLGYIARRGNRDLNRAGPSMSCNEDFLSAISGRDDWTAKLTFGPNGEPRVELQLGDEH